MSLLPMQTYSPGLTSLNFLGNILTGFGDDIAEGKRNSPTAELVVGADGEVAIRMSADRTGEISVTLKQTSMGNAILGAILARMELGDPTTQGPVFFSDNLGNIMFCAEAILAGPPESVKRGKDIGDQVWKILCSNIQFEFSPPIFV